MEDRAAVLVDAADGALPQAKRDGGNRICVFQQQGYIYTPTIGGLSGSGDSGPETGGGAPGGIR